MKRTIAITLLLGLVLALAVPLAGADGDPDPKIITPYVGGPNYRADAGQEVIIRAGWIACNQGLSEAFRHANSISMEIRLDGAPYMTVERTGPEYWSSPEPVDWWDPSPCVSPAASGWGTESFYSLGTLHAGEYFEIEFVFMMTHPLPDGGDFDGDGQPDVLSGVVEYRNITITVE